jgi:hypothetical protein
MLVTFFILFIGLEIKHFVADYFMQPAWMLVGKGDLKHYGGYVHAAVHAGLSGIVLLVAGTPLLVLAGLVFAEWLIHYIFDFSKIYYSRGVHIDTSPGRFWALHGFDQILHQLTYAAMIYAVLLAKGMA